MLLSWCFSLTRLAPRIQLFAGAHESPVCQTLACANLTLWTHAPPLERAHKWSWLKSSSNTLLAVTVTKRLLSFSLAHSKPICHLVYLFSVYEKLIVKVLFKCWKHHNALAQSPGLTEAKGNVMGPEGEKSKEGEKPLMKPQWVIRDPSYKYSKRWIALTLPFPIILTAQWKQQQNY